MQKKIKWLSIIAAISTLISALIGLFYTNEGSGFTVKSIYGESVELFGDGIYAYNSVLKAGTTKGTDLVTIGVSLLLLFTILLLSKKAYAKLLVTGLQCGILYESVCLIMGISFNRLYPLYLIQFSSILFAFLLSLSQLKEDLCFNETLYNKRLTGTAIFMMIGGCSVLVWLTFIIPAVITGSPSEFIEIYTTEPTFALDLGIIFPSCIATGIGLLKKNKFAYAIASVLLTLITCVGACVIAQTIVQMQFGIVLSIGQMVGLVVSFVILGCIATVLNYRLYKNTI